MYKYLLLTLLLTAHQSSAQRLIMDILDPSGANLGMRAGINQASIEKDVFLTDWQDGYVVYGAKNEKRVIRYNTVTGDIHLKNTTGKEEILPKGQVEYFAIISGGTTYRFRWLKNIEEIDYTYAQIIYENKVRVYYHHHRKAKKASTDPNTTHYGSSLNEETIIRDDAYILILPSGKTMLTKAKKKDILRFFEDKKADLELFIKKEKIETQNLEGLMKVVQKYEELSK
ncbi:MAG: hypothetical protein SFU27_12110 [Thermonemataceae bacterium]|nr:hypothetical protein [Thermonemataceae bacterium]